MKFSDFRSRALREGLRYGQDRLVLLRELAQNARDAGASRIDVITRMEDRDLVIQFTDDGSGMSYAHAKRYLFTLYASSKETDTRSAGRYGVGFWSVLLFNPDHILIESMTADGEAWAMAFDGNLQEQTHVPSRLGAMGTRITVRRHLREEASDTILSRLEEGLVRYCRYLRRNDKAASILPVNLNGRRIDQPFSVDGPCWMAFRCGNVEGAVGLGHKPSVELYARGLLVWHGTTINELKYGADSVDDNTHPEGLAPVYVINGNNLSVTLDRRAVVDNKELARVRRVARRRMRELVGRYLDSISRRPFHERVADAAVGLWEDLRLSGRLVPMAVMLSLVLVLIAGFLFVPDLLGRDRSEDPGPREVVPEALAKGPAPPSMIPHGRDLSAGYDGPMVDPLGSSSSLMLSYSPDVDIFFRTTTATRLHPGRGIVSAPRVIAGRAPPYRCAAGCVDVELQIDAPSGLLPVPVPTGHRVEPTSIALTDRILAPPVVDQDGQPLLSLDTAAQGTLRYRTGPGTETLEPRSWNELLSVPGEMRLAPSYASITATAASEGSVEQKVAVITAFVRSIIGYDRSVATAAAYRKFASLSPESGWAEFVTTIGRGDCDVKNTMAVLMLRRAGVPSRLAIGFAGEDGRALSGMHAWVEYHEGTWVPADATGAPIEPPPVYTEPVSPQVAAQPAASSSGAPAVVPQVPKTAPSEASRVPEKRWAFPRGLPRTLAIIAAVIAAFSGTFGLMLLLAGRGYRRMNAPGGRDARRRIAAQMLMGALVQPEIWLKGSGLASRRLLPVLGVGRKMSLSESIRLGDEGRLFHSTGLPELARKSVAEGARILDASDHAFKEIISRISKAVDLDQISLLEPVTTSSLPPEQQRAGRLIEEIDRLVGLAGWPEGTVVSCPRLEESISRDVDLSGLGSSISEGWPSRFVAVSPSNREVYRRSGLMDSSPGLAAFMLLDLILARSQILSPDREVIRARAAVEALGGGS